MKSLLPPELQAKWDVRDTVPRRERLAELAFAGYSIPRCGLFKDMVRLGVPLVVYADELAHCGDGKVLYKPSDETYPPAGFHNLFCSEYVPDGMSFEDEYESEFDLRWDAPVDGEDKISRWVSRRILCVGRYHFAIVYTSRNSWMTNVDGEYEVVGRGRQWDRASDLLPYPMYAIDYTEVEDEDFGVEATHFDLNTCPGVPLDVVNMVGRDVLTASVADFCRERGLV